MRKHLLLSALLVLAVISSWAKGSHSPSPLSSTEVLERLQKLNVMGSVLYIAAHPDDENTRLISWLANDKKVRTAYLSLTRGDGGQNLIGTEKGELIGVLRTQELLEARKIDGGQQFFSRAVDFGYSKTSEETFQKWDEQEVLRDMVWVIRQFRPDIIITRFPKDKYAGHGHHSASAILAEKAFDMAGDPAQFPEQLSVVTAWKPNRMYHNTSEWWDKSLPEKAKYRDDIISIDVGSYNPNLGQWHNQIAMESRSQHKSQGFGASLLRGEQMEYLQYIKGQKAGNNDLFQGLDISWKRLAKTETIQNRLNDIIEAYDPRDPSKSVPDLVELYQMMEKYPYRDFMMDRKKEELKQLIFDASGLWIEAIASEEYGVPGSPIRITAEIINAGNYPGIDLDTVHFPGKDTAILNPIEVNKWLKYTTTYTLPANTPITQPYWLTEPYENMFVVRDPMLRGLPENPPTLTVGYKIMIGGTYFTYTTPVVYKWRDRVDGENVANFSVVPDVTVNLDDKVYLAPNGKEQTISVTLQTHKERLTGKLELKVPEGWDILPANHQFTINTKGTTKVYTFRAVPGKNAQTGPLKAQCVVGPKTFDRSLVVIDYLHIHKQVLFPKCEGKLVAVDLQSLSTKVGYIKGAGDEIPEALMQMGLQPTIIVPEEIPSTPLDSFDVILTGIRAYNTQEALGSFQELLLNYVEKGGLLVVQYNTNRGLKTENIGPYPFSLSRDRVTDEYAEVRFKSPDHSILQIPNKLSQEDFEGWVQERGLYFANKWDNQYETVLSWNDPGEKPMEGGLIAAPYGKGHFVYTGISFFRQLPAGVEGAYRLFANILSYGKQPAK
ncbi:PIG-L family deacetylase [bacterium SCSIO 12741]|nr:PIG-L family deacetylase [bacterium SCSIO 12741]